MAFRNLLKKLGAWTTVIKWQEPRMYRVRLKGDWIARLAWAFAIGSLPTTLLLVLFAINVKPPHPLFAFTGMLIVGGLAFMFLVNGRRTAGGWVRLCEEGIIRKRMYVGLSSQWVEEWSWPYSQIPQCAIIPGESIGKSFSVLMLTNGTDLEFIGIPERVNLGQVRQLLIARGVVVRHDIGLPPEFVRPMGLPIPIVAGAMSLVILFGGLVFYAMKTAGRDAQDVARVNREARQVDRGPLMDVPIDVPVPNQMDIVTQSAPTDTPPVQAVSSSPEIPNVPSTPPSAPPTPSFSPPAIVTNDAGANPTSQPQSSAVKEPATATPNSPPAAPPTNRVRTDQLGGTGGVPFDEIPPERVPIIGFRYRLGSWSGKSAVASLEPVSRRDAPAQFGSLVIAREGFVVGGIQVDAEDLVQAVRVVFVKQAVDGTLDKTDYYFSDWIGQETGRAVKTLGKGNVPVIGVYGRRGLVIDAIGLVLAE